MTALGRDPQRAELPGVPTSISVSTRWIQRGFNAWRAATSSRMAAITEDGVWGPNTLGAVTAMISNIRPASLTTVVPSADRRSVIIDRVIEGYLAALERAPAPSSVPAVSSLPVRETSSHPILDAGEGYLTQPDEGTPGWVYALAGVSLLLAGGITYATLSLTK